MPEYRVREIRIPPSVSDHIEGDEVFNSLPGISRLNILLGPNNSGKSRLMRAMFLAGMNLEVSTNDEDATLARTTAREVVQTLSCVPNWREKILEALQKLPVFHRGADVLLGRESNDALGVLIGRISDAGNPEITHLKRRLESIRTNLSSLARRSTNQGNEAPVRPLEKARFAYIPTLRGMRMANTGEDSKYAYFDRTFNDYIKPHLSNRDREIEPDVARQLFLASSRSKGKQFVYTGLEFYDSLTESLLGDYRQREGIRAFEDFLSDTFFGGKGVTLIPKHGKDTVHIQVGRENERPVQELGDGLQQVIILTLPLFESDSDPLFLFIEEPDLFLHPGYQRILIKALLHNPEKPIYVFVTTHSNQFIDATLDDSSCSIFRCQKNVPDEQDKLYDPKFSVQLSPWGNTKLLHDIGVRPSSILFANCTIWVEGIWDRLYLRRFLEIFMRHQIQRDALATTYTENLHYAFVEYGGNNITHWSFLDEDGPKVEKICAKLMLIADRDDSRKDERHKKLADALGPNFLRLNVTEIENTLTPDVIMEVIKTYERGEETTIRSFNQASYANQRLGKFIDSVVPKTSRGIKRIRKTYAEPSGTIKDKETFCLRALEHIHSLEDMSTEAKRIARIILCFIVEQNS